MGGAGAWPVWPVCKPFANQQEGTGRYWKGQDGTKTTELQNRGLQVKLRSAFGRSSLCFATSPVRLFDPARLLTRSSRVSPRRAELPFRAPQRNATPDLNLVRCPTTLDTSFELRLGSSSEIPRRRPSGSQGSSPIQVLAWRNWQTRRNRNLLGVSPCGFESHRQHRRAPRLDSASCRA